MRNATAHAAGDAGGADRAFRNLVEAAADRYRGTTITAHQFARGKLWNDEVYRSALLDQALPSGGLLLDIGCGQGLSLALFLEARRAYEANTGRWPAGWPPPARFDRLIGIERRVRVASLARQALGREVEIVDRDARREPLGSPRVVLLFDVLQMIPAEDQEALLSHLAEDTEPGGVLLVREADAAGGLRFRAVGIANRAKALAFGAWDQRFHFRSRDGWHDCFRRTGWISDAMPMHGGAPFANVLFRLTRAADAPADRTTP